MKADIDGSLCAVFGLAEEARVMIKRGVGGGAAAFGHQRRRRGTQVFVAKSAGGVGRSGGEQYVGGLVHRAAGAGAEAVAFVQPGLRIRVGVELRSGAPPIAVVIVVERNSRVL